jgi:hypothetical protein
LIIAGWVQSYRVHGLRVSSDSPITRGAVVDQSSDKVVVVTTFSHEALEPVYGPPEPRYAFVGQPTTVSMYGVSTYNLQIDRKEKYRLRALTDDLPELGPHGPESSSAPYLK